MGGIIGINKDLFIDMMIQTNKIIYTAGQFLDGVVNIDCKDSRHYGELWIRFWGIEYVSWKQGSEQNQKIYQNSKQIYNQRFKLTIFADKIIPAGQYTFPFGFLLSSQLSGSIYCSEQFYIRYKISCQLIPTETRQHIQIFSRVINILQPIRQQLGAIQKQNINYPVCCGCCIEEYGIVKVSMNCEKNIVRGGEKINVTVFIDNTKAVKKLQNICIQFLQQRWKISSCGKQKSFITNIKYLRGYSKVIQPGQTEMFTLTVVIPSEWLYSTAIGSILSNYHILRLTSQMGCCSMGATCQVVLFYQSINKRLQVNKKNYLTPDIWMPKIASQVSNISMKPFIYRPHQSIPCVNRFSDKNKINLIMPLNEGYFLNNLSNSNLNKSQHQL